MDNKVYDIISIVVLIVFMGVLFYFLTPTSSPDKITVSNEAVLSEDKAIELIKKEYPELEIDIYNKKFNIENRTEQADDGWYVSFLQSDSGKLTSIRCFKVNDKQVVSAFGEIIPKTNDINFDPKTCIPI